MLCQYRTLEGHWRRWGFPSCFWYIPLQDITHVVSPAPGSGNTWWPAMPSSQQLPPEASWTVLQPRATREISLCAWLPSKPLMTLSQSSETQHLLVESFPQCSRRQNYSKFHLYGTKMIDFPSDPQPYPLLGSLELMPIGVGVCCFRGCYILALGTRLYLISAIYNSIEFSLTLTSQFPYPNLLWQILYIKLPLYKLLCFLSSDWTLADT